MKKIILTLAILFNCFILLASPIDENTAKAVGLVFLKGKTGSPVTLHLVYKASFKTASPTEENYFYVFNNESSIGFVMVAADDIATPILGYSDKGSFDPNNIPPNAAKWFDKYRKEIRYAIENKLESSNETKQAWLNLKKGALQDHPLNITGVAPLLTTLWNQSPYYNALCPFDNATGTYTVTGCVATAMAQVMKYWNYPANGAGFHSYNHDKYGTLSADFGNTTYQWASMPSSVTSNNSAVATLMYQVGVSVDMNYGAAATGGSGAYVISSQSPVTNCAEYALKTYFGYKNTIQGIELRNYSGAAWITLLEAELNAGRPIIYAGFGTGGGHCFVADGFDNNNFFHFNWGWAGAYNGYFSIDALDPAGVGTGGGTGGFNSGEQAVIGIQPPSNTSPAFNLNLYDYVTPSSATIGYAETFSIYTDLVNYGTGTFNGDYCAAIFDDQNNFVDYVQILTQQSIGGNTHYTNGLTFTATNPIYGMVPGIYSVGIFYRPAGGNWVAVPGNGNYSNFVQVNVVNNNDIRLYSPISVTSGTVLTQGQTAFVDVDIANFSAGIFTGEYDIDLYNLDGTWVQSIGYYIETDGLPSNFYRSLSLSGVITAAPGTYLLAITHLPSNGALELTGADAYPNPIQVMVQASSIQPDKYEVNNAVGQSYNLPLTFNNNNAAVNTVSSNCHVGTDYDYYKLNLPVGYNYVITARLHDSYNSANGIVYSLDALFSYSKDAVTWSDTYDDVMPANIVVNGGGVVYFDVAPYFTGTTGTYLLDIQVSRIPAQFTWTGVTSNAWSTGANWSGGVPPTSGDDIIIPAGTIFSPTIASGVTGLCRSIKVNNGATVTIATGGNLKVAH